MKQFNTALFITVGTKNNLLSALLLQGVSKMGIPLLLKRRLREWRL